MGKTMQENMARFKGIFHLVLTPFDERTDELDEHALRESIRKAKTALTNVDAVFMGAGSTAEFYAMSDAECRRYISVVLDEVAGEFPTVIGTGRSGTRYTIEMSRYARDAGADAVMVVNPYYYGPTEEGLFRHFIAVADALDIGVYLYNNATQTKFYIPVEMMVRLSKVENIIGVKENTTNPMLFYRTFRSIDPKDMTVVCGSGHEMFPYAALCGCESYVTELVNFIPEAAIGMYEAARGKRYEEMMMLIDRLDPYVALRDRIAKRGGSIPSILPPPLNPVGLSFFVSISKEAMRITGTPFGKVRAPLENLSEVEIRELSAVLSGIVDGGLRV